jgi:hypothetical protein
MATLPDDVPLWPVFVMTAKCLVFVEARFEGNEHTGENYSDAILRLVETEGGRAGRPIFYSLPRRRCYAWRGVDRPASRHAGPRSLLPRPSQRSMEARPCPSQ